MNLRPALFIPLALLSFSLSCSTRGPGSLHAPGEGVRASCKGRLILGEEKVRFRGSLALSPPDRIRVEMRGPVGGTRAVFTQRSGRLLVLLPASREYIDESADADTMERLLGVHVDGRGLFELISSADPRRCGEEKGGQGVVLTCRDGKLLAQFEGGTLELELEDVERRIEIPEDLFAPEPPEGWTRLPLDERAGPGFFLR